ncbi:hypothetical protein J6590_060480 [Homalodisca vitripennis]|nr:hypothetical protein J6590_060480 [Homalodisca vitripennis]
MFLLRYLILSSKNRDSTTRPQFCTTRASTSGGGASCPDNRSLTRHPQQTEACIDCRYRHAVPCCSAIHVLYRLRTPNTKSAVKQFAQLFDTSLEDKGETRERQLLKRMKCKVLIQRQSCNRQTGGRIPQQSTGWKGNQGCYIDSGDGRGRKLEPLHRR